MLNKELKVQNMNKKAHQRIFSRNCWPSGKNWWSFLRME